MSSIYWRDSAADLEDSINGRLVSLKLDPSADDLGCWILTHIKNISEWVQPDSEHSANQYILNTINPISFQETAGHPERKRPDVLYSSDFHRIMGSLILDGFVDKDEIVIAGDVTSLDIKDLMMINSGINITALSAIVADKDTMCTLAEDYMDLQRTPQIFTPDLSITLIHTLQTSACRTCVIMVDEDEQVHGFVTQAVLDVCSPQNMAFMYRSDSVEYSHAHQFDKNNQYTELDNYKPRGKLKRAGVRVYSRI